MVATRLSEVTAKGIDWAYGGSNSGSGNTEQTSCPSSTNHNAAIHHPHNDSDSSDSSSYWSYATSSMQSAADRTYATVAGLVSNVLYSTAQQPESNDASSLQQSTMTMEEFPLQTEASTSHTPFQKQHLSLAPQRTPLQPRSSSSSSSMSQPKYPEFTWMLKNPYSSVRGRHANPQSLDAVRSLLTLVPEADVTHATNCPTTTTTALEHEDALERHDSIMEDSSLVASAANVTDKPPTLDDPITSRPSVVSKSETASQLAEGTLRALRDLQLDEAVELHDSLRYWTIRWERPFLSWLEAGPWIWFSKEGYNHKVVGQKVSQIQAVLARRCAAIGELQQHLLRAGWQQGVAQWGVLGQGGQWAAVSGFDGAMSKEQQQQQQQERKQAQSNDKTNAVTSTSSDPSNQNIGRRRLSTYDMDQVKAPRESDWRARISSSSFRLPEDPNAPLYYGHASVVVRNIDGGTIQTDNPALAAWSVDAMRVVRDQLYRAGNGRIELPCEEHWNAKADSSLSEVLMLSPSEGAQNGQRLPIWASSSTTRMDDSQDEPTAKESPSLVESDALKEMPLIESDEALGDQTLEMESIEANEKELVDGEPKLSESSGRPRKRVSFAGSEDSIEDPRFSANRDETPIDTTPAATEGSITITNLPMMATEVSELLNAMEVIMQVQRRRRLNKLKALSRFRRCWYNVALASPVALYVFYKLFRNGEGVQLAKIALERVQEFCREHVAAPISAILTELVAKKNRDTISDHRARVDAIESLKKMIRSWLDETFPEMDETERASRAELMDMSLIEQKKEGDMKTIYEINSVIRMSFIEMQFIKKEMMNALYAMDEMMTSNEINLNLAAVTPAVLLIYAARYFSRFLYYALLRLGKSREETYASCRHVVLDIERLLVMRDHPPAAPPPLQWGRHTADDNAAISNTPESALGPSVLSSDDLGMLMLHIHECRTILWEDRGRFSPQNLRDLAEDLAELAGERGVVSVQQQLQMISRMCRTYPFLKVVSTGVNFDLSRAASRF